MSSKSNSDGPTLYRVDPTGHFSRMKATAAGKWETECLEWLEARIGKEEEEEKEDMEDSLFKAVQCLKDGARKAGGAASRGKFTDICCISHVIESAAWSTVYALSIFESLVHFFFLTYFCRDEFGGSPGGSRSG